VIERVAIERTYIEDELYFMLKKEYAKIIMTNDKTKNKVIICYIFKLF
tara:strand:- start:450 stop:593 length:144 start_codon:yes stop_codon:yes gene_type:complete